MQNKEFFYSIIFHWSSIASGKFIFIKITILTPAMEWVIGFPPKSLGLCFVKFFSYVKRLQIVFLAGESNLHFSANQSLTNFIFYKYSHSIAWSISGLLEKILVLIVKTETERCTFLCA